MLKSLLSFFFEENDGYSFYKLYNKLVEWEKKGTLPYSYELPKKISFPPDFWTRVIKLYKLTRKDRLERAVSIYYVDGELVFSNVNTGNDKRVTTRSGIRVEYKKSTSKGYYTKIITLDGAVYSKKDVYYKRIPNEIVVKYLFNIHTHPPHKNGDLTIYSYFSATDIKSLYSSKAIITGMIGDKLHLIFKTQEGISTVNSLTDKDVSARNLAERYSLAVYEGQFKSSLNRLFFESGNDNS